MPNPGRQTRQKPQTLQLRMLWSLGDLPHTPGKEAYIRGPPVLISECGALSFHVASSLKRMKAAMNNLTINPIVPGLSWARLRAAQTLGWHGGG